MIPDDRAAFSIPVNGQPQILHLADMEKLRFLGGLGRHSDAAIVFRPQARVPSMG